MKRVGAGLLLAAVTLALLETGTWALVRTGFLETPPPRYGGTGFWRGHHPEFGVWHEPNADTQHASACFSAHYATNSIGARDVERNRRSGSPRVIVLGDSFLEGWGVSDSYRVSNQLERLTRRPHLNFAMSHFSPYQQWIVYERLASEFDHDAVIASVAPHNDFLDLDLESALKMARYEYRYRPYLIGDAPNFEHLDYREPTMRRALRRVSYLFNALIEAMREARSADTDTDAEKEPSKFFSFTEREFQLLEAALERLADSARPKRIALLVIPVLRDLEQRAVSGPDPLTARLEPVAERLGIQLVHLLPAMADYEFTTGLDWNAYFFPCDYHWSRVGNRAVARMVREQLGASFWERTERRLGGRDATTPATH